MAMTSVDINDGGGGSAPKGAATEQAQEAPAKIADPIYIDFAGHADTRATIERINAETGSTTIPAWMEAENMIMQAMIDNGDLPEGATLEQAAELFEPQSVSAAEFGIELPTQEDMEAELMAEMEQELPPIGGLESEGGSMNGTEADDFGQELSGEQVSAVDELWARASESQTRIPSAKGTTPSDELWARASESQTRIPTGEKADGPTGVRGLLSMMATAAVAKAEELGIIKHEEQQELAQPGIDDYEQETEVEDESEAGYELE